MEKSDRYFEITSFLSRGNISAGAEAISVAEPVLSESEFLECVGNLYFYKREFQQAVDNYEKAMNLDPNCDSARYHYLVGVQYEKKGQFADAFKRYQASIEIEPSFVDAYVELGGLLVKVKDFEGALKCYTDALRIDETDIKHFSNRLYVLQELSLIDHSKYGEECANAQRASFADNTRLPLPREPANW